MDVPEDPSNVGKGPEMRRFTITFTSRSGQVIKRRSVTRLGSEKAVALATLNLVHEFGVEDVGALMATVNVSEPDELGVRSDGKWALQHGDGSDRWEF
jgi:hypothetical protein